MEDLRDRLIFVLPELLCGPVFILISLPLVFRKIPMNRLYGIRLSKAYESDELWYRINEFGGKQLVVWSLILIAVGIAKWFILDQLDDFWTLLLWEGPLLVCVFAAIIITMIYEAFQ